MQSNSASPISRRAAGLALGAGAVVVAAFGAPAPLALALGVAVATVFGSAASERWHRVAPSLLAASVVGLGAGIDLRDVMAAGMHGATLTLVTASLCLSLGLGLGRVLRVDRSVALLVAVGTAICGGSAIVAISPVLGARREQTAIALGTVFALNAMAMLALPVLGHALGLDPERFGTLAALAVHDTSAVVGAAASFGDRAVEVATTVKLARVLMLVPLSLALSFVPRPRAIDGETVAAEARPRRSRLPWFVLGFVAVSALVSSIPSLAPAGAFVASLARRGMVVSLFLVGASLSRGALRSAGLRPLALGFALWLVIASVAVGLVVYVGAA